jgi:hypothetical protein
VSRTSTAHGDQSQCSKYAAFIEHFIRCIGSRDSSRKALAPRLVHADLSKNDAYGGKGKEHV